jgi:ABC-2 type transport system permease protein
MINATLLFRQVRYTNKSFWRNPASAFFTFAFPLLFLVIFTTLLGNGRTTVNGVTYRNSTYFAVAMGAFGLITACYTNLAMTTVFARDEGILKRIRGTPIPSSVYLGARVLHAVLVGFILVAITLAVAVVFYGASFPAPADLFRFLVTLVVGAGCFAALGLAVSTLVPNADAGPAIVNAIIFPLLFLSGVFFAIGDDAPAWVTWVGRLFPVRHYMDAMRDSFLGSPGFRWADVLVVAIWMVAAALFAARSFRWESAK